MLGRFDYDLVVIGSGDAGGRAALMASKAGLSVALVEANKWGGSALNFTDIPNTALLYTAHVLKEAQDGAKLGISSTNLRYNYPTVNNWKNVAMKRMRANSSEHFEERGIHCIHGNAHFLNRHTISVGERKVSAKKFLIATGASVLDTGISLAENANYWLPENVCTMVRPPKSIFIVGAGSTGCEYAQFFRNLGCDVVIADLSARLLPREDEEVGQVLDEVFNKDGIKVLTQSRVVAIEKDGANKKVVFMRGGQEKSVRVSEVLLCTGSAPNIDLGLENAGVVADKDGIRVDETMQTSMKHIFAAGDVIGGHSSPDKAHADAKVAVSHIIGRSKLTIDYSDIIRSTNIAPELAAVGITEDDCIKADRKFHKSIISLDTIQKAQCTNRRTGFVKIITSKGGKILGATIMAPHAEILIQEFAMAIRFDLGVEDLLAVTHPYAGWSAVNERALKELRK